MKLWAACHRVLNKVTWEYLLWASFIFCVKGDSRRFESLLCLHIRVKVKSACVCVCV
jgi:hypothetical protein